MSPGWDGGAFKPEPAEWNERGSRSLPGPAPSRWCSARPRSRAQTGGRLRTTWCAQRARPRRPQRLQAYTAPAWRAGGRCGQGRCRRQGTGRTRGESSAAGPLRPVASGPRPRPFERLSRRVPAPRAHGGEGHIAAGRHGAGPFCGRRAAALVPPQRLGRLPQHLPQRGRQCVGAAGDAERVVPRSGHRHHRSLLRSVRRGAAGQRACHVWHRPVSPLRADTAGLDPKVRVGSMDLAPGPPTSLGPCTTGRLPRI